MKFVKKLTALFLAIVMTMAMGITAFAATPVTTDANGKVKLTINEPVDGHVYKVYQLLTGDVTDLASDGTGTLSNIKVGSSVKAEFTDGDAIADALKDEKNAALGNKAASYIDTTKSVGELYKGIEGKTDVTSIDVVPGYYVIIDADYQGTATENIVYSRNLVAVTGPTTVTPKTETPSIDKNITNTNDANKPVDADADGKGKTDSAAIGDTINFQVDGTVPNMEGYTYYYYIVNDELSDGLCLDKNSFKVTIAGVELTKGTDYNVYYTETTEQDELHGTETAHVKSFQLAFNDLKQQKITVDGEERLVKAGDAIVITYNAVINEDAKIGLDPNTNTVKLKYSNNPSDSDRKDETGKPGIPSSSEKDPTGTTPESQTKTYVTELKLIKIDQDGNRLSGASFTLTGENLHKLVVNTKDSFAKDDTVTAGHYYKLENGAYTDVAPTADKVEGEGDSKTITYGTWRAYADVDKNKTEKTEEGVVTSVNATATYTKTTETEVIDTTTNTPSKSYTAKVNDAGELVFTGLNKGDYKLHEAVTPDGYNTIEKDIEFTIGCEKLSTPDENGKLWKWSVTNKDTEYQNKVTYDSVTGTFEINVTNIAGTLLPSTGGMGTAVIYVAGIAMIVAAGVVVIVRKRFA